MNHSTSLDLEWIFKLYHVSRGFEALREPRFNRIILIYHYNINKYEKMNFLL